MSSKPHAVLVPCPAQGHITPFMQLAKLLHSRGFHITFVNTEFNHNRMIRTNGSASVNGLKDFRFETIPEGLPPSDRDATQDVPALCASIRKHALAPFLELVKRLNSSPDVPPVKCIIADGVMGFAVQVAEILGIPKVQFWTASACGFMGYLQFGEFVKRGILPFKDETFMHDGTLDKPIDWIPGMPNVRLRDLPSFIRITDLSDIMFDYMGSEAQSCITSPSAIIINTFDAFENEVLIALNSRHPHIYTVGPLPGLIKGQVTKSNFKSFKSNLWKEDTHCLSWLDSKKENSVIYVNYGSITTMSDQHLIEFAWGLANSKCSFIWIVRPDVAKGNTTILTQDFLEEVKERGFITSWCPQEQVLGHASVGAFLTHCGWNSTLESLSSGVPVICWPFFAEQQTNCRYSCTDWEIGMEVNQDVKREEVEKIVKEMMEGEKGRKMRSKAQEWKRKAKESVDLGGSSYINFENFVKYLRSL